MTPCVSENLLSEVGRRERAAASSLSGLYHDDHCDALQWLCFSATIYPSLVAGMRHDDGEAGQLRMVALLVYWIVALGTVWPLLSLLCTKYPAGHLRSN